MTEELLVFCEQQVMGEDLRVRDEYKRGHAARSSSQLFGFTIPLASWNPSSLL